MKRITTSNSYGKRISIKVRNKTKMITLQSIIKHCSKSSNRCNEKTGKISQRANVGIKNEK